MPRKQKKYHYIYKTTCDVNGKYYIGMHSTNDLNDGYMGSGKRLWYSFNYHGKDNHTVEILEWYVTRKGLRDREAELVNDDLLKEELCMNLKTGGEGGGSTESANSTNQLMWVDERDRHIKRISKQSKDRMKNPTYLENWKSVKYDWSGKNHSEETKQKMSTTSKGMGVGKTNSQYGTCWITKDGSNRKVKKEDLNIYLEEGWIKGRKLK